MTQKIKIDNEFKGIIPPLSDDEYKQLEDNLKKGWESERGKIIVWGDVIIDGHNRYEICQKYNIPFEIHAKEFKDRNEVLLWIIDNQRGRRNIPDYARIKLELRKAEILRPLAQEKQSLAGGDKKSVEYKSLNQISDKAILPQIPHAAIENKPLSAIEEKPIAVKPKDDEINITKQVAEASKKSYDTVSKVKYIASKADDITQNRLMKGDSELSINKVYRDLKKAEKRKEIIENFKEPEAPKTNKKYNIIYADPPWSFEHYSDKGKGKSPDNYYKCQSLQDIKNLPISEIADDNCILFMWVTYPFLEKGLDVIKAWGFQYKTVGFTWVKRNKKADSWFWGMGYWTRSNAEICIIATQGTITRQSSSVHQIIDTPIEEHSKKPDVTRERIVELCGDLPRIELFARQKNEGWDVWGNEVL